MANCIIVTNNNFRTLIHEKVILWIVILFIWGGISPSLSAQNKIVDFQKEFTFCHYLINQSEFGEAVFLLNQIDVKNLQQTDSVNYLKGWALYSDKQLQRSALSLEKVSPGSVYFPKARFFAAYNNFHLEQLSYGDSLLMNIDFKDDFYVDLKNFQLAGSALLKKDMEDFDKRAISFHQKYYQFSKEEIELMALRDRIGNFKPKSPALAGLLSALVPGLGKIYSGHIGAGVSTFFMVTTLCAITWENYHKAGSTNPKTWIYGSAFALTYSANIYGSVYSVKAYRDEFDNNISKAILFNLHIPLRNSFN